MATAGKQRGNKGAANLIPHQFQPGQSGNPSGRPKGSVSLVRIIHAELEKIPPGEKRSHAEAIVDQLLDKAHEGDMKAIQLLVEHVDGKPMQRVELTGDNGEPMRTEIDIRGLPRDVLLALKASGRLPDAG